MARSKRTHSEINDKILSALSTRDYTISRLHRTVGTNYNSILDHCTELERFGFITMDRHKSHPTNSRDYIIVSLTSRGKEIAEKKKKAL